jgi:glycosyltransferase involved in cell wall biosynthesis
MKFSIVIPAHNEQDLISRVIAALKAQNMDRREFEIIVVDNDSDDMTGNRAIEAGADLLVKEIKARIWPDKQDWKEPRAILLLFWMLIVSHRRIG